MSTIHQRCDQGAACVEVVTRYLAATEAHGIGLHQLAEEIAATADRFAEIHGLWEQLENEVTS